MTKSGMKLVLGTLAILATGCSFVPAYDRPAPELPASWKDSAETGTAEIKDWWKAFEDPVLSQLVSAALDNNRDIGAARYRIEQARAEARIAGAPLYPQLDGTGSASRRKGNGDQDQGDGGWNNSFGAGVGLSYELDFWGGNRARRDAATLRAESTEWDARVVMLLVSSETVRAYTLLLALNDRLSVARNNIEIAEGVLRLIEAQFEAGAVSALERAQQRTSVSNTVAVISVLERQHASASNQLAVLIGKAPAAIDAMKGSIRTVAVPQIAPFSPESLLTRRPDILRAEAELIAANFDVGAARAAYFPKVQLGIDTTLSARDLTGPSSTLLDLGGALTLPIFRGGALLAEEDRTEARKQVLVQNYQQTILVALGEVEDALAAVRSARERVAALGVSEAEARNAYDIAKIRFEAGKIDYQPLLETQRALLLTADAAVQAELEYRHGVLDLYKALGGGWGREGK